MYSALLRYFITVNKTKTQYTWPVQNSAKTTKTVTKLWDDSNDKNGVRPKADEVHVQLMQNDLPYGQEVTLIDATIDRNNPKYTYTWIDLPLTDPVTKEEYTYTVVETAAREPYIYSVTETAVDGYKDPSYGVKQESDVVIRIGGTSAEDGQYIINTPQDAVSLPKTGGPGTKLLYSMGIIFTAMAGLFLFIRRRRVG